MKQIPATINQLKKAFRFHYKVYKKIRNELNYEPMTKRLILFYSVESGLKHYLLKKIKKNTTDDFNGHLLYGNIYKHGHDLRMLIKYAKIGNAANYQLKPFISSQIGRIEPEQFHQIWRYGIETNNFEQEDKSEKVLQNIAHWLEERI